jgi:hypothetical protein
MPTITYDGEQGICQPPRYELHKYHVYVIRLENGLRSAVYVSTEFHDDAGQERIVQMLADNLRSDMASGQPC